jgi:hypothetical protein
MNIAPLEKKNWEIWNGHFENEVRFQKINFSPEFVGHHFIF